MLRSRAENTSGLKVPPGAFRLFQDKTAAAIYTGAVQAVCGAIEQMRVPLRREGIEVRCYLAGGAAHEIAPHLTGPLEVVDNLVLEGVLALAAT